MSVDLTALRARARHYLSDEVAQAAGLRLADLLGFVAGTVHLTDAQRDALARRVKLL